MSAQAQTPQFHFKNVENQIGEFFQPTRPDGFRDPRTYFSWAVLNYPRGLHSHPDADELAFFISGEAEIVMTLPSDQKDETCEQLTFKVKAGDVVLFPQGYPHRINADPNNEESKFIAIFNNNEINVTVLE